MHVNYSIYKCDTFTDFAVIAGILSTVSDNVQPVYPAYYTHHSTSPEKHLHPRKHLHRPWTLCMYWVKRGLY